MATESACLPIAGVEIDHARNLLADLMGTIVKALRPGYRLANLAAGEEPDLPSPRSDGPLAGIPAAG